MSVVFVSYVRLACVEGVRHLGVCQMLWLLTLALFKVSLDTGRHSFVLPTPRRIFGFTALPELFRWMQLGSPA